MFTKKSAIKVMFLYLLATSGLWAFISVISNSYNRLSAEKVETVNLTVAADDAYLTILNNTYTIDTTLVKPKDKYSYAVFLALPDEAQWLHLIKETVSRITGFEFQVHG